MPEEIITFRLWGTANNAIEEKLEVSMFRKEGNKLKGQFIYTKHNLREKNIQKLEVKDVELELSKTRRGKD